jgi:hypothetical protein
MILRDFFRIRYQDLYMASILFAKDRDGYWVCLKTRYGFPQLAKKLKKEFPDEKIELEVTKAGNILQFKFKELANEAFFVMKYMEFIHKDYGL